MDTGLPIDLNLLFIVSLYVYIFKYVHDIVSLGQELGD